MCLKTQRKKKKKKKNKWSHCKLKNNLGAFYL